MNRRLQNRKRWYALYTRPRWEKKVFALLKDQGIEAYCPLNKVRKKWSDRFKVVEEPLFKSYVFVNITEDRQGLVRLVNGVVNFVYWLGKPAEVKEQDILRIKRFMDEFTDVQVIHPGEVKPGDKVIITSGLFMEQAGTILSTDRKMVEVKIESLGCVLVAQVERNKVILKDKSGY